MPHHLLSVLLAQALPYVTPLATPFAQAGLDRARTLTSTDYALIAGVTLPACAFALSVFREHRKYRLTPVEREARRRRFDPLVWVNTKSRIYYFEGHRWFKRTQVGMMLPLRAAQARGNRPVKSRALIGAHRAFGRR